MDGGRFGLGLGFFFLGSERLTVAELVARCKYQTSLTDLPNLALQSPSAENDAAVVLYSNVHENQTIIPSVFLHDNQYYMIRCTVNVLEICHPSLASTLCISPFICSEQNKRKSLYCTAAHILIIVTVSR